MKILFVGYGYVGSAVGSIFNESEKIIVDPKINNNSIVGLVGEKFDCVIVSVDTPKNKNASIINSVLIDLNYYIARDNPNLPVLIKSTTNPYYMQGVEETLTNLKIAFSPEYLAGRNNITDFKNQKFLIIGSNHDSVAKSFGRMFLDRHPSLKKVHYTDLMTSILVKYAENAFLATKVTFMNEMYNIHKKLSCDSTFEEFGYLLGLDERIGHSHTHVPGWDGKYGWGGHCLDKDVDELIKFSGSNFFKSLIDINTIHRNETSSTSKFSDFNQFLGDVNDYT